MSCIRRTRDDERDVILAIINSAAEAYRGVIPADRWHDPYMDARELEGEIAAGSGSGAMNWTARSSARWASRRWTTWI